MMESVAPKLQRSKLGFVSLGCPKNFVDTETMIQQVSDKDFVVTGDQSQADIVVVNTCGFLAPAQKESMDTIGEFIERKRAGGLRAVVVAGCMTERYLDLMRETYPEVDAFIRTGEFSKLVEVVEAIDRGDSEYRLNLVGDVPQLKGHSEITDFVTRMPGKRPFAYVKISEGCNRNCSFCIIPKLRGRLHSRRVEGIVDEVRQLATSGVREVIFIAQDLTSYGRDLQEKKGLLDLLKAVEEVEGLSWYRLMYNYPKFFTDELIDWLAASEKFSGYVDIPLQHISRTVLKNMRRPETPHEIRDLIGKLRSKIPGLSLRTTLLVGFPGETEADFDELLEFIQEAEFDHMGAFPYYRETGTDSADRPDQLTELVKQERYGRLMALQSKIQEEKMERFKGRELQVIVDAPNGLGKAGKLQYLARHAGQAPEVDGLTYLESLQPLEIGSFVDCRVIKAVGSYDLLARAI